MYPMSHKAPVKRHGVTTNLVIWSHKYISMDTVLKGYGGMV
jgi:hypothetical protein